MGALLGKVLRYQSLHVVLSIGNDHYISSQRHPFRTFLLLACQVIRFYSKRNVRFHQAATLLYPFSKRYLICLW